MYKIGGRTTVGRNEEAGSRQRRAEAGAPGERGAAGRGRAGGAASGQGNRSSRLKTRTVLPRQRTGKHFLETQLKIIVLIFYVNG